MGHQQNKKYLLLCAGIFPFQSDLSSSFAYLWSTIVARDNFTRSTATERFHSSSRIGSSQQKAGLFPTHFNMRGGRQEILRLPQAACHHVILHDNRAPYIIQLRLSKQIHHNKAVLKCECRKRLLRNQAFTKKRIFSSQMLCRKNTALIHSHTLIRSNQAKCWD